MNIRCEKCGQENDLGRIFCTQCGARLDLTRTSIADIDEGRQADRTRVARKIVGYVLVFAVIGLAGLAAWPGEPLAGGSAEGAQVVDSKIDALMEAANAAQAASLEFTGQELNAYLAARAKRQKVESVTLALRSGYVVLRVQDRLGPWTIASVPLGPLRYSYDVTCYPQGNALNIRGVRLGHLPVAGPPRTALLARLAVFFEHAGREREALKRVTGIVVREGAVEVKVGT